MASTDGKAHRDLFTFLKLSRFGSILEPFMEWVNRTGMDMEWGSDGYRYFCGKF